MKYRYLLLLIPFVGLVACQAQKEINVEKAKEIIQKIKSNKEYDPFVFTMTNKGAKGKGDDRFEIDLSYKYDYTPNAYYSFLKGVIGDTSYDIELYCVKNSEYEEVKFARYFDIQKNEYIKAVAVKKDNENYDTAFADLGAYRTQTVLDYYLNVDEFNETLDEEDKANYYSSKDGQLTLKYSINAKNPDIYTDEVSIKGKSTYKYENYCFVSVDSDSKSNYGNSWITKGSVEYKANLKVELPSDWKNYLRISA